MTWMNFNFCAFHNLTAGLHVNTYITLALFMSVNSSSSFFLFHAQTHRHLPFPDSVFNDRDHLYLLQRLFIACHIDAALNLTECHGPQPIHNEEDKVVLRCR